MTILSFRCINIIRILYAAGALVCATAAYGQGAITTISGGGFVNNAPALESHLTSPQGVAVDAAGNVYVADAGRILKLDHATGILAALAGSGTVGSSAADGPALSVRIAPTDLGFNAGGNLLFLDSSMLRQLNLQASTVTITTLAGQDLTNGNTGDSGPASAALLNLPQRFCQDTAGNIYIVELAGYVRKINLNTGVITTIAGNGGYVFSGDNGPATSATLVQPSGIAVDSSGNVYIADSGDLRIRKINAITQIITTIAGDGHAPTGGDGGSAAKATFDTLGDLAIDSHNNLYLIDGSRVRRITATTGDIATVAGNGTAGFAGDGGQATQAELNMPAALTLDSSGDVFIADTGNQRIRMVATTGVITTIAGTSQNGDGGLAAGAVLANPQGLAVDATGDLFIASGNLIRKVSQSSGLISTFAGGGTSTQDGIPATQAQLNPLSLAFDSAGNLLVGEVGLIRSIGASGTITSIAGTGVQGFAGDGGQATQAQIGSVSAMTVDSSGNLLFVDAGNKRLRRIDTSGVITTVAGNGVAIFTGLGSSATQTAIGNLAGVAVDSSGNIYIGGLNTFYLLKISQSGGISYAGGDGGCAYIGDGGSAAITVSSAGVVSGASICQPSTLAIDSSGNLYVGDTTCSCVRQIAAGTGIIQTVAGNGSGGYSGDNGPATQAQIRAISAIALYGSTLYIADAQSAVVRGVTPDAPPPMPVAPTFSSLVSAASFLSGPVAPGELVSFFGNYLGPATPGQLTIGTDGRVTNQIPNVDTQVFFDGVPAPLTYVAAGQINAVVPYSVANGLHTVMVQAPGGSVSSTSVSATGSAPAIFPNAVVNQDASLNNASQPAAVGSYVVMYGTGLGQITPAGSDGDVVPLVNFPSQVYTTTLSIGRNPLFSTPTPMQVLYAGPAPGLVSGVCQIDVVIPAGTPPGENYVVIVTGPGTSPAIPVYVQ